MFFIRMGSLIAWGSMILGSVKLASALFVAYGSDTTEEMVFFAKRYWNAANTGEVANEATSTLFWGVMVGLLVEIAKAHVSKKSDS